MELPVAPQSYQPAPDLMVREVRRARGVLARVVAREESIEGATAFFDPARPGVDIANFALDLQLPAGRAPGATIAALLEHYRAQGCRCSALDSAEATWPAGLDVAAGEAGFRPMRWHVMRLGRYQPPSRVNPKLQIIPARSAYAQLGEFCRLIARHEHGARDEAAAEAVARALVDQLDEQRYDAFLARLDGKPVGFAGVLALGQTGVIQAAFADPDCRGQSVGSTIMAHTLDHCARALFERVLIERHEGCPSIPFYAGLGFAPAAEFVRYHAPHRDHA